MRGSLPDGIWLMALNGARVSQSQSLLSNTRASRELLAGGPFFFRRTDFSTPTSALPMELFLWAEQILLRSGFNPMKRVSWQIPIRVIIIHYDAKG